MSRVGCAAVHLDNRLYKSIRPNTAFGFVVFAQVLWCRTFVCGTSAAALQRSSRSRLNRQESDGLPIRRGTKQADLLSSLLFNTVLLVSLEEDLERWQEKKKGIRLSDKKEDCLTNLRFADDVLLFSTSPHNLEDMLCGLETKNRGSWLWNPPEQNKDSQQPNK